MNLQQLDYFATLARIGSYTKAAQCVHISQSTLSASINRLESEMGQPLIDRSSRNFKLTVAGEIVLDHAHKILKETSRLREDLDAELQRTDGCLTIGVTNNYDYGLLRRVLEGIDMAAGRSAKGGAPVEPTPPPATFVFKQGTHGNLIDSLRTGEIDLAFSVRSSTAEPLVETDVIPLGTVPLWCNVAAGHRLAGHETIVPSDLEGETIACYSPTMRRIYARFVKEAGVECALTPHQITIPLAKTFAALGGCVGLDCMPWAREDEALASIPMDMPEEFSPRFVVMRRASDEQTGIAQRAWEHLRTCQRE